MSNLKRNGVIPMESSNKRILSPFEFVNLTEKERLRIKSTRIVSPVLGKRRRAFGGIEVTFDCEVYRTIRK